MYYVINVYVPRVRANAYHTLTTPPRVLRDPKMCLRNIWTAPYSEDAVQMQCSYSVDAVQKMQRTWSQ